MDIAICLTLVILSEVLVTVWFIKEKMIYLYAGVVSALIVICYLTHCMMGV